MTAVSCQESTPTIARRPIRVLVADDSEVARDLIAFLLNVDPAIEVVGTASNGEMAVEMASRLKPDVITMDIHMPRLNGYEATRRIMETCPTRIVMVTASALPFEVAETFKALEAGALTVVGRPLGPGHAEFDVSARELRQTVKLMSEVSVVRRWEKSKAPAAADAPPVHCNGTVPIRLVAIGASTGGPLVLETLLSQLPAGFAAPIAIVQHMSAGFTEGFANWLGETSGFPVELARHGTQMRNGQAYVAPDNYHMCVNDDGMIVLVDAPPENNLRPAVSYLFRSVNKAFGSQAVGVLLTGMGCDGAAELKAMREAGAITIAQDKHSSVVNGMPGAAVELGAVQHVLAPDEIAALLRRLVGGRAS
jgi:two-component system chemotaxis response regulator CheB